MASFRTESRAALVAAEVTALGMPMRRRTAEGWQQVLAGPFASRALADEAQKRLGAAKEVKPTGESKLAAPEYKVEIIVTAACG